MKLSSTELFSFSCVSCSGFNDVLCVPWFRSPATRTRKGKKLSKSEGFTGYFHFWAHLCPFTVGSYASLSVFLSVRLCKLTRTKVTRKNDTRKKITSSYLSNHSRSKVKWVKPGLKAMILADGLTPTSSCIFFIRMLPVLFLLGREQKYGKIHTRLNSMNL